MSMRRMFLAAAAVAGVALAGNSARADTVATVDSFSNPAVPVTADITAGMSTPFSATLGAPFSGTLASGIDRSIAVTNTYTPPPFTPPGQATASIGGGAGGVFNIDTPTNSTANATIGYSNLAAGGLSNFSALGADGLQFTAVRADLNIPYHITLSSAAGSSTFDGTVSGAGTYSAALSAFTGNADLSNLTGISLQLNGPSNSTTSADFAINNLVVTGTTPTPVPAPPAAALVLAALPALGLWRRSTKAVAPIA